MQLKALYYHGISQFRMALVASEDQRAGEVCLHTASVPSLRWPAPDPPAPDQHVREWGRTPPPRKSSVS